MILKKTLSFSFLLALLLPGFAAAEFLTMSDAWVREPPPMARVMVGYVKVHNPSSDPIWVVGAKGADFGAVELHESFEENGVARMRHLSHIKIEPGESVAFEPGGKHLMLFRPQQALKKGDTTTFALKLGNGQEESFQAVVKKQ